MLEKKFLNYQNKNILITGGAGFIGSKLVLKLKSLGANVLVVDNLSTGSLQKLPTDIHLENFDINELEKLQTVFLNFKPKYVFHLAAYSRTQGSSRDKCIVYNSNVCGTSNIVDCCVANKIRRLVYSASSTFYGSGQIPNSIDSAPDFGTHYAISKFAGEEVVKLSCITSDLSAVSLRYFSVYGDGQPSTGIYALVMGIFLDRVQRDLPLIVHGDGTQRRDFVHVDDVVTANLLAGLADIQKYSVINIGTGESYSIIELAKMISNDIEFSDSRAGDARETRADLSECIKLLNWAPKDTLPDYLRKMKKI
jgi:UDP-glucose 4-epimerase